jgi:hypothetical protein
MVGGKHKMSKVVLTTGGITRYKPSNGQASTAPNLPKKSEKRVDVALAQPYAGVST